MFIVTQILAQQWRLPWLHDGTLNWKFSTLCSSTRWAWLSSANTTVKFHRSPLLCQDLSQCWIGKVRKNFSTNSLQLWNQDGYQGQCRRIKICLTSLVFKNIFKSSLLLLMTLPDLNDTVLHSCYAMTVPDTKLFQQYITCLISDTLYFVLIGQEKPLRWKEKNTRTHAHTQNTKILNKGWLFIFHKIYL